MPIDAQLSLLLYRLGPVALRQLMVQVARYLREQNANRILAQRNADGSAYTRRKHGRRPMLVGYARRIRERVEFDHAVVGIFGRMGVFGAVHDKGKVERRIKYPARNILRMADKDKQVVFDMAKTYVRSAV